MCTYLHHHARLCTQVCVHVCVRAYGCMYKPTPINFLAEEVWETGGKTPTCSYRVPYTSLPCRVGLVWGLKYSSGTSQSHEVPRYALAGVFSPEEEEYYHQSIQGGYLCNSLAQRHCQFLIYIKVPVCARVILGRETTHRNKNQSWGKFQCTGHNWKSDWCRSLERWDWSQLWSSYSHLGSLHRGHLELGTRMKSSDSRFKLKGHIKNVTSMDGKSITYGKSSQSLLMNKCNWSKQMTCWTFQMRF